MSFLGRLKIDDDLTFYANTHDPATGGISDADSAPSYRVYEEETGTAILTGNLALLDDANTTGFYSEQIALSAANGFEVDKSYGIYMQATVNGVSGSTNHSFRVEAEIAKETTVGTPAAASIAADIAALNNLSAAQVNAEMVDAVNVDVYSEATGVPPATASIVNMLMVLYMALRNEITITGSKKQMHDDAGNVEWEKDLSDDGTTFGESQGNAP